MATTGAPAALATLLASTVSVGAEPGGRVVVELVGREDLDVERLGVVGEEVLGRIELGHRGAAADEGDGVDLVVGQDVGDYLLGLVEVDLVHVLPFLSPRVRGLWVGGGAGTGLGQDAEGGEDHAAHDGDDEQPAGAHVLLDEPVHEAGEAERRAGSSGA